MELRSANVAQLFLQLMNIVHTLLVCMIASGVYAGML